MHLTRSRGIARTLFDIQTLTQVTNINNWRRTHDTSERGEETKVPRFRAILEKKGKHHGGDDLQHRHGRFVGT